MGEPGSHLLFMIQSLSEKTISEMEFKAQIESHGGFISAQQCQILYEVSQYFTPYDERSDATPNRLLEVKTETEETVLARDVDLEDSDSSDKTMPVDTLGSPDATTDTVMCPPPSRLSEAMAAIEARNEPAVHTLTTGWPEGKTTQRTSQMQSSTPQDTSKANAKQTTQSGAQTSYEHWDTASRPKRYHARTTFQTKKCSRCPTSSSGSP